MGSHDPLLRATRFLQARSSVDRRACERSVRTCGHAPGDPGYEPAKERWRALPHLLDALLFDVCREALSQSLGRSHLPSRPFPAMIWYGGASDTERGFRFKGTTADFVEHVLVARSREVADKRKGWVVTPTSNVDGHRTNASTTAVHALNLDCDGRGSWAGLLGALFDLGITYIAYESGGSTEACPKWHLLIPLAEPWDTSTPAGCDAWKVAYQSARVVFGALGKLVGEGFDPTVEAPSVPIFVTERRQVFDPPRRVVYWLAGRMLDLRRLVEVLPVPPPSSASAPERAEAECQPLGDARLEAVVQTLCRPMSKILSSRRDLYLALPGALLDRGVAPDDVRQIIEEVSFRCPGDPSYTAAEVDTRHREHLHGAETTIARWESQALYTRVGTVVDGWPEVANALDEAMPDPALAALVEAAKQREARWRAGLTSIASTPPAAAVAVLSPPAVLDLGHLYKRLQSLRRQKKRRKAWADRVDAVLLGALLSGDDLVPRLPDEDGGGRGGLLLDESGRPYDRARSIAIAAVLVSQRVSEGMPFSVLREVFRPSLFAMLGEGESMEDLMKQAEAAFNRAIANRIRREKEQHEHDVRDRLSRLR